MNVVKEDMVVQVYVNMIQIQKNGLWSKNVILE